MFLDSTTFCFDLFIVRGVVHNIRFEDNKIYFRNYKDISLFSDNTENYIFN